MNLADNELLVIGASADTAKYFFERLSKELTSIMEIKGKTRLADITCV